MEIDNLLYLTVEPNTNNIHINLDYIDNITFESHGSKETFSSYEIMSIFSRLMELNRCFYDIIELAHRKDEIFKRLDTAKYGTSFFE